jgi:hypothetical protein
MARSDNRFIYKPAGVGQNGPGAGDGWGGPARGAGRGNPPRNFNSDTAKTAREKQASDRKAGVMSKADLRRQRTEQLEDLLFDLATSAEREETKVSAATKLHAIYNGQPVARNLNVQADDISQLTDDELRAELARAGGTSPTLGQGDDPAGMPAKLSSVLH